MSDDGRKGYVYEDFEQIDHIGSGGNADVHKSTVSNASSEYTVALKTPRMSEIDTVDTSFFDEFLEEAELWAQIDDHENIVSVFDWGGEPYPWIALEYMDGGNLTGVSETLSLQQRADIFEQICDGVYHAHRHGISHCDLKPENILLSEQDDGSYIAKVADWGLANVLLEHSQTMEQMTLMYAAPEQVDSSEYGSVSDRTDIYQLGVIGYELFADQPPFDSEQPATLINKILNDEPQPPSTVNEDLPASIDEPIQKAIAKRKEDRYEAVPMLRNEVVDAIENEDRSSHRTTPISSEQEPKASDSVQESSTDTTETDSATEDDATGEDTASFDTAEPTSTQQTTPTGQVGDSTSTETQSQLEQDSSTQSTTNKTDAKSVDSTVSTEPETSTGFFEGLWARFQVQTSDVDFSRRGTFGDMRFAYQYARTMEWSTMKSGIGAVLLIIPLYGYLLDVIEATGTNKQEVPPIRWKQNTIDGIKASLLAGVVMFASMIPVAVLGGATNSSDSIAGLVILLWILILPATIISYAINRSLLGVFSRNTLTMPLNIEYIGMIVGSFIMYLVGYFSFLLSSITIVGILPVGFLWTTASGAYIGRRYEVMTT